MIREINNTQHKIDNEVTVLHSVEAADDDDVFEFCKRSNELK